MKKNTKGIIVVLVLTVVAAFLIYKQRKSTIKEELRDFAVKDTAKIDKLFLADKKGNKSLLERRGPAHWVVNGKLKARQDAINTLLTTISNLSIKYPLAKAAFNNILKQMAAISVKVEIYQEGDLEKVYYVGGQDMDGTGTYMMIENSSTPFIMEIPGFQGYLTPRYISDPVDWRDKHIFNFRGNEIEELKMVYNVLPEASFQIKLNKDYSVNFKPLNISPVSFDTATVKEYLTVFTNVVYDTYVKELKKTTVDSIKKTKPFHEIYLKTKTGQQYAIKTFPVKAKEGATDKDGNPLAFDLDFMYASLNDTDFVYVQYYTFDQILKPVQYFKVGGDVMLKSQ
jgi:hypothetical protein